MKKDQSLSNKLIKELIVQENYFLQAIIVADHNHHIETIFAHDPYTDENHIFFHKTDIAD